MCVSIPDASQSPEALKKDQARRPKHVALSISNPNPQLQKPNRKVFVPWSRYQHQEKEPQANRSIPAHWQKQGQEQASRTRYCQQAPSGQKKAHLQDDLCILALNQFILGKLTILGIDRRCRADTTHDKFAGFVEKAGNVVFGQKTCSHRPDYIGVYHKCGLGDG